MKQIIFYTLFVLNMLPCYELYAQTKSEDVLVNKILTCLQRSDDSGYAALFPKAEDLVKIATDYQPQTEDDARRIVNMIDNRSKLESFDPAYNSLILSDFESIIKKGKDSGLHWNDILLARFELQKMRLPEDLTGFEKIATIRLGGFVFVKDMLTRRQYMVAITDVLFIGDKWYGGRVMNVLEADSEEEYNRKLAAERKAIQEMMARGPEYMDSLKRAAIRKKQLDMEAAPEEEVERKNRTEIVERKLFVGTFDNETPVELYFRSLKGGCPAGICAWEAMYRLGDMDYFIALKVVKSPEGIFSFTEDDEGIMELKLSGQKFNGTWISFKDKTEYEVRLKEKEEVKSKKLFKLDTILESIYQPDE